VASNSVSAKVSLSGCHLKVRHGFCAWQKQIEIEINTKFQNARGVLENPFKAESKTFCKSDIKASTVIPPIVHAILQSKPMPCL
jgi:hypothetical protein